MEVLYNILIEIGISRKQVGLIKMCLNETCTTVVIGNYRSDKFPVQNGLKHRDVYHRCFTTLLWITALGGSNRTRKG
jgi:hypothetical protein